MYMRLLGTPTANLFPYPGNQLYHNPPRPEVPEEPDPELSLEEIERIVAEAPDIFDPLTWR